MKRFLHSPLTLLLLSVGFLSLTTLTTEATKSYEEQEQYDDERDTSSSIDDEDDDYDDEDEDEDDNYDDEDEDEDEDDIDSIATNDLRIETKGSQESATPEAFIEKEKQESSWLAWLLGY